MSQDSAAALSLLSLSMAASEVQPIPLDPAAAASANANASASANGKHPHHRRMSSTGRRRRLSDARDAATRPLSVGSPGLSMAGLSLSTSATSASPTSALPHSASALSHHAQMGVPASAPAKSGSTPMPIPAANGSAGNGATGGKKKRGVDHKCEACSKIYRHPSCLIKHRWEHTPHWRTLSALPHPGPGGSAAGVQLLEAAAILSHLSPDSETGTSLPEDRGMWPRWVSGGSLEGEEPVSASFGSVGGASEFGPSSVGGDYPPSSVGASEYGPSSVSVGGGSEYRSSGGPRLHDYEVPRGAEVRAGVVEVPHARSYSHSHAHSYGNSRHRHNGSGGWSVPRSVSVSASLSSSRSTPSDDEEAEDDADEGADPADADYSRGRGVWKREREEEFGFEVDLGGVREEDGEDEYEREEKERKGRYGKSERESLRWGGMEEMDDIDMDMD
ncbi:C2H2-type domain-containing protein [Mycena sanguinolenta]|uniref:C2H2-type domain-containing protein n=1 Tax=Mycena sanguinolenta TaxID=230812 RepID=A0A8H7DJQ7_9AGAR|nr:C2H2-type domain-containing protein [Mycena sanguinolenta]